MSKKINIYIAIISMIGIASDFDIALAKDFSCLRVPFISAKRVSSAADIFFAQRLAAKDRLGPSDIKEYFEIRRHFVGGKGAWNEILEYLGFSTVKSVRLTIQDVWDKFICDKKNKILIEQVNSLIDAANGGKITKQTESELIGIIKDLDFPEYLEKFIELKTKNLKGKVIIRLCGKNEDSYIRNLAGVFSSPKKDSEKLIVKGVKEAFLQAIEFIWINQNISENPREGISNKITSDEGFALDIQEFLDFDASGTANTDVYGHNSIEAVIGDTDSAVRPNFANTVRFLFKEGTNEFEYSLSFVDTPYEFTLKGKRFCMKDNNEELKEAMAGYPKINNIFSPIDKDRAVKLNNKLNELRSIIGVPIDVEWGVKDAKLHFSQVRPIIGDFNKKLVEPSPELADKELIAETHLTLGQTQPKGFTGKVVLFGNLATDKTIMEFEKDFGNPYIRIQNDVAGSVYSLGPTKANVLVDVSQGSLQAHCVSEISNKISNGEFAYANGPILRNGFYEKLHFIPHKDFKGVWVSEEDVTYFSSGLKGEFYLTGSAYVREPKTSRQKAVSDFEGIMSYVLRRMSGADIKDIYLKFFESVFSDDFLQETTEGKNYSAYSVLLFDFFVKMAQENKPLKDITREDLSMLDIPGMTGYLYMRGLNIESLKEALSFPLYPRGWENDNMRRVEPLLSLGDLAEILEKKEKLTVKKEGKIIDKYTTVIFNHPGYIETVIENNLDINDMLPELDFERMGFSNEDSLDFELAKINYKISFLYIHVHGVNIPRLIEVLKKVRQVNPQAKIYMDSGCVNPDDFWAFQINYGEIVISFKHFEISEVCAAIKEDFNRWKREKKEQKEAIKPIPEQKPEYPEKLNILMIDDQKYYVEAIDEYMKYNFDEKIFNFKSVTDVKSAKEELDKSKYDLVIYDLDLPGGLDEEIIQKILKVPFRVLATGASDKEQIMERIPSGRLDKPFNPEEWSSLIKNIREEQVQQYELTLAEWQKLHPEQTAEQMTVLWIDDDKEYLAKMEQRMLADFGNEKRLRFVYTSDINKVAGELEKYKPYVLFLDLNMPRLGRTAESISKVSRSAKSILAITGGFTPSLDIVIKYMFAGCLEKVTLVYKIDTEFFNIISDNLESILKELQPIKNEEKKEAMNLFIITNLSGEGAYLAEDIEKRFKYKFNIIRVSSMAELKKALKDNAPDLVITDSYIDKKEEIENILKLSRDRNPDAEFIITSEEAVLLRDRPFKGFNILGIVEKPFHFTRVIDILETQNQSNLSLEQITVKPRNADI